MAEDSEQSSVEVSGYLQLYIYTDVQPKAFPLYLESFENVPLLIMKG